MTEYLDSLINACQTAKSAKPINEFTVYNPDSIPDINKGIYIIREIGGNPDKTHQEFIEFKASKSKACCKVNKPSQVLYVGSSTTGIKKRLTQHLVNCADQTYALHLYAWFKGKYQVVVLEYDEPNEVIQLIEDNISNNLKPAFGKQGGNNM